MVFSIEVHHGGHVVHPVWNYVSGDVTLLADIDVEKQLYFEFVGILKEDVKLKECKGVFKLWWNAGDDETKEFALDSQPVELYNYYVNTNNVVNVYVEVLNGSGNEVATVGNEKCTR